MEKSELIRDYIHRLPESAQSEVLDFIEFLVSKSHHMVEKSDGTEWSDFSLESAMRGMENETEPEYSDSDIMVKFS